MWSKGLISRSNGPGFTAKNESMAQLVSNRKSHEISVLLQSSAISVRYRAIFMRQQPGFRCRQNLDNQSQKILRSHLKHNAVRDKEDLSNSYRTCFRQPKQLFTSHPKVLGSLHKPISPLVPMINTGKMRILTSSHQKLELNKGLQFFFIKWITDVRVSKMQLACHPGHPDSPRRSLALLQTPGVLSIGDWKPRWLLLQRCSSTFNLLTWRVST